MKHVVMFSGGAGSWAAAKRVAEQRGTGDLTLLFADTLMEDEDLYRFLDEAAANVGGQLVKVAEGRDPWQVFFDRRFLGNTRVDPCSEELKRNFLRRWLEEHCAPQDTVVYLGFDWTEPHRMARAARHWVPWRMEAPLMHPPHRLKEDLLAEAGIEPPLLYRLGFPHNNCGGFCIKAGHTHFKHLLRVMPDRYAYHERREQELRDYLGKDVATLRDRAGGVTKPLTLRDLRLRVEAEQAVDADDWGGCGCFVGDAPDGDS